MASMIMITGSMYLVSYIEGKQKLEFAKIYSSMADESVARSKLQPHGPPISKPG